MATVSILFMLFLCIMALHAYTHPTMSQIPVKAGTLESVILEKRELPRTAQGRIIATKKQRKP